MPARSPGRPSDELNDVEKFQPGSSLFQVTAVNAIAGDRHAQMRKARSQRGQRRQGQVESFSDTSRPRHNSRGVSMGKDAGDCAGIATALWITEDRSRPQEPGDGARPVRRRRQR